MQVKKVSNENYLKEIGRRDLNINFLLTPCQLW